MSLMLLSVDLARRCGICILRISGRGVLFRVGVGGPGRVGANGQGPWRDVVVSRGVGRQFDKCAPPDRELMKSFSCERLRVPVQSVWFGVGGCW